jgi:integrase
MKLTKRLVEALECEANKPVYVWDATLPGFAVKALPSGLKKYLVKYRTQGGGRSAGQRWLVIGTHGQITLEQARKQAQQVFAAVTRGEDPQSERFKLRAAPILADVWKRFADEELGLKKLGTVRDYVSMWDNDIAPKMGKMRVEELSRRDVDALHKALKATPYRANRVLALLSRLMTLTEAWEWRIQGSNPCRYVKKFKETPRERYLSKDELYRLGEAMRDLVDTGDVWPDMANAIMLLLLTGARKNEILTCEWEWVQWDQCVIFLPDSKTGKKQLYLSAPAIRILALQKDNTREPDSKYVFPGRDKTSNLINLSKPWKRIQKQAGLEGVRLHDLRHTAASIAVGQGVGLPIVGRLLGHSQAQTTHRYAHVDTDPALKAANTIGEAINDALGEVG